MKSALKHLSSRFQAAIEFHLDSETIRSFLLKSLDMLNQANDRVTLEQDLYHLESILCDLGWVNQIGYEHDVFNSSRAADLDMIEWRKNLEGDLVIHKNFTVVKSGFFLEIFDSSDQNDFVEKNMEALLRHVEIYRRDCFPEFFPSLQDEQAWLERLDILILFSRYGRRHRDLRFLNAALKMHDFWFKTLAKRSSSQCFARFAVSLAEQESSAKELLQ